MGLRGLLGWEMVSTRIDKLFLTYAHRFEWSDGDWGEAVWRSAKMQTVTTSWWKRTQDKCQYYDIDFEKDCTGLSSWRKYVHFCVERKAKEDWLMRARMKCSLRFLTMDGEEGFGRRAPLYGSWESKYLSRLWMGDILTSNRRIHWESRDTQQCLCCKKDCLVIRTLNSGMWYIEGRTDQHFRRKDA